LPYIGDDPWINENNEIVFNMCWLVVLSINLCSGALIHGLEQREDGVRWLLG